ncbi:archaellin/type IV pilin N-terminal domain-containing protein [Methanocalculus sp.]|uniref:archaellin/type IV pilin N-terminal domain-containing protein n=1 Tax=Methanocalculus sp. TaxID=2004547 RepID=UPI00261C91F1|nr:archaellin/type IV pilin N-terminal domain-containing protein [Methanocalculus sp.]MDG6251086.1 type IV pilin [Methanocalculus sp.]
MSDGRSGEAVSQVQGVLLLVVITIILAVLLFLMLHIPLWQGGSPEEPPEIFAITQLSHYCEKNGGLNYDSRMTIINSGVETYFNDDLRAEIFVNGRDSGALISSMNAHIFISTYHIGVERMEGPGSTGFYWYPGSRIFLDLTDGTFRPGDSVRLDVYHKDHDRIISRSERIA